MSAPNLETQSQQAAGSAHADARIDFATSPGAYKHWKLSIQDRVAQLALDVDETSTVLPGYELKLNSYDLGVDIV